MTLLRRATLLIILAAPAFAQLDSLALRAKFGSPLNRETFHTPAGFDLVVDYGTGSQACRLNVPALMPTDEKVSNADVMKQRMYAFLADLVPVSMRGRELNRHAFVMGIHSVSVTEYEHVTVSESQPGDPFDRNNTITITFKSYECSTLSPP